MTNYTPPEAMKFEMIPIREVSDSMNIDLSILEAFCRKNGIEIITHEFSGVKMVWESQWYAIIRRKTSHYLIEKFGISGFGIFQQHLEKGILVRVMREVIVTEFYSQQWNHHIK